MNYPNIYDDKSKCWYFINCSVISLFNSLWPSDILWWQTRALAEVVLLPDGTKPLPEPSSKVFTWEQFPIKCSSTLIRNRCSEIILLNLLPHLPGAKGLYVMCQNVFRKQNNILEFFNHSSLFQLEANTFSFIFHSRKCNLKWLPFCSGLNVLTHCSLVTPYGDTGLGQHRFR